MADGDSTCAQCGGKVPPIITKLGKVSKNTRKYCSAECVGKAKRIAAKDQQSGWIRNPRRVDRDCLVCGRAFKSYTSTGADGGWTRHCSLECGRKSRSDKAARKRSIARIVAIESAALKKIGIHYFRLWPHQGGPRVVRAECYSCGCALGPVLRRKGRHACEQCKRDAEMKGRRVAKAKRRAIERGADADQIDPIRVFERDKWRCQECGCRTPQLKRGSFAPNAPELDHIISLADGGAHTWANVQCLCRQCNQEKGASSRGQLHMFAA